MINPLVSVVVPVYNVEHYIHRSVDSLLNQTYPYLDIILVDDGSSDLSPQICDEYAKRDGRIRVIHKKNGGVSDARNVGLDMVRGKYLTFLDSDDYIAVNAIEQFVQVIQEQDVDIVCCGINIVDSYGNIYDYRRGDISFRMRGEDVVKLLFKDVFPYNFAHSKLYKSSLFDGIRFPFDRIYEDMATTYRVISRANNVYCMKDCMYYYERGREGNITSELHSPKAAWSYYCGCLNCKEYISFCEANIQYREMLSIIVNKLYIWSKLCLEASIPLGWNEYNAYNKKIKRILEDIFIPIPIKLKLIMKFSNIYYYLWPLIKRRR